MRLATLPRRCALALLLALSVGCASSAGPRDTMGWLEARGADFMDIVGVRVAFGAGLGAYVRATYLVQLGFMARGPSEGSLPRPEGVSLRAVPCFMFGTIGRYGGAWFDSTREVMLPGWSTRDLDGLDIDREVLAGYVTRHGRGDNLDWSFGAGLHFLLVGAEAEVRPFEVIDFLAGVVGYDPSGDDVPVVPSEPEDEPPPAAADAAADS